MANNKRTAFIGGHTTPKVLKALEEEVSKPGRKGKSTFIHEAVKKALIDAGHQELEQSA